MKALAFALALLAGLLAAPLATGEVAQQGTLRVSFGGGLAPKKLPRVGSAPISVSLESRISTTDGSSPPTLSTVEIGVNRAGRFETQAVPYCRLRQIQSASTARARRVCGASQIGEGSFAATVSVPEASPFPAQGTVSAFNGLARGEPAVFLHVYGTEPLPTSFTLPLRMRREQGRFGTVLRGSLPAVDAQTAFVTRLSLRIGARPGAGADPYLSAGCPAPRGFPQALFPLARASFEFIGGITFSTTLERTCIAQG